MSLRINTNVEAFNAHRNSSRTQLELVEVDGEAVERPAHQPRRRRRRRPGDLGGHARPDPRHRAGQPQRPGRHLAGADGGRRAERDARDPAARPRAGRPVDNGTLSQGDRGRDHGRGRAADGRARPDPRPRRRSTASPCSAATPTITFQVGANSARRSRCRRPTCSAAPASAIDLGDLPVSAPSTRHRRRSTRRSPSVADARAELGAIQNRLEHTVDNLGVYQENLSASESRIRDVDMAPEMVNFTRLQILSQSGTAMLAQANQTPQAVLQLLQRLIGC